MNTTTNETNEARATYKAIRSEVMAATGCTAKAFDALASNMTREYSDGEETEPKHWVSAAYELRAYALAYKGASRSEIEYTRRALGVAA